MNLKESLQSKEIRENRTKAKFVIIGFVLIFAFFFFGLKSKNVGAISYSINGTNINGEKVTDEEGNEVDRIRDSVLCESSSCTKIPQEIGADNRVYVGKDSNQYLTFIQGSGVNNTSYIRFLLKDIPTGTTSFAIVETGHSDSAVGDDKDLDRYNIEIDSDGNIIWIASGNNKEYGGIKGSAIQTDNGIQIVYRIRNGEFGLKFLKVFFYNSSIIGADAFDDIELFYVISNPIDLVELGGTCTSTEKITAICTNYVNGSPTRESRDLNIYIPKTVAYIFKSLNGASNAKDYYNDSSVNTIYAINYFKETADGEIETPNPDQIGSATQKYLYTNFTKHGDDTQATAYDIIVTKQALYKNYLDSYKANQLEYMQMKVDSTGAYFFYITDIFGNVSRDIYQKVTDVKNRSIETKILKENANGVFGYDAEETFTNQSVKVEITMTVQTNFEFGVCLDNMCAGIIKLTNDRVKEIRYWRVDVRMSTDGKKDLDGYDIEDSPSDDYASENFAEAGTMRYLYCLNEGDCTRYTFDKYDDSLDTDGKKMGSGFVNFEENKIIVYIANSGRYRFYIEDTAGNNTFGPKDNRNVGEYRNPRVEVYGIDKAGPEITFEHEGVSSNGLKKFDIETFEYYYGINKEGWRDLPDVTCNDLDENISNCYYKDDDNKWHFIYDARIKDGATTGYINNYVYYSNDSALKFNEEQAIRLSKVRVSDYIYKYNSSDKLMYADFSTYDRENEQYKYKWSGQANDRVTTIRYNAFNNSNGLMLVNGTFEFKSITFYHYDNVTKVCDKIGGNYIGKDQYECVNYYLDHGVDFIIEFEAEDAVGNTSISRIYVNVEDTTPPGFIYNENKKIGRTNTNGNICRIEIGGVIGKEGQTWQNILECYNVYLDNGEGNREYKIIDNVYDKTSNDGLKEKNRINKESLHVKLYIKNNNSDGWVDLKTTQFIPNRTGYYDIKIVVEDYTDTESNSLTVLASYYVDKRIVLVEPIANSKEYGQADPTFEYCTYVGDNTTPNYYNVRFSSNPYSDKSIYKSVYCSTSGNDMSNLFQTDTTSTISGELSRQESGWYNNNVEGYAAIGITNNYVGTYNIILGTLNIVKPDGDQNEDYIVKIYPFDDQRADTKLHGTENGNKIIKVDENGNVSSEGLDNEPFEDDNGFTESTIKFTIKQVVLKVAANGGNKKYGDKDTNSSSWDDDSANLYLNGISIIDGLKYNDEIAVVKGTLRRTVGENVGIYTICNYRGNDYNQEALEEKNNMYIGCNDGYTFNFNGDLSYIGAILNVDEDFMKSRALYIETNKSISGKTLNTTTLLRDNNYANYVIDYIASEYVINPIDLVLQVAPGQRREYAYGVTHDPNPWEIILYGLAESKIVKDENEFNGYTDGHTNYGIDENKIDTSDEANLEANFSENRSVWNFVRNGETLKGLKTNETYSLLRSTNNEELHGAKVLREEGGNGGWYLYKTLGNDIVVTGGTIEENTNKSKIAVITNGMNNCTYDVTGHVPTVDANGISPCKNYNLIYSSKYTTEDGYTIENKGNHEDSEFVYKSAGKKCTELDPERPCSEDNKYDIQFEIYRRDIIIEFNSAVTTFMDDTTKILYGYRYDYYEANLFAVNESTNSRIENRIFLCYAKEDDKRKVDCTNDGNYGLTLNDTWSNIGLTFRLSTFVSGESSGYYHTDTDRAIPAGVYFVYADINNDQKANYNFKYRGGTLIIKSKPIDIEILNYTKEYGERTYSGLKESEGDWTTICILDSAIRERNVELIDADEYNYCGAENGFSDITYNGKNIYGFYSNDIDRMDTIVGNFLGRPQRETGEGKDVNGMQDGVGIYRIGIGSIVTTINNPLSTCTVQNIKGEVDENCAVVENGKIPNYVINTEIRNYLIDMYNNDDITSNTSAPFNATRDYSKYRLDMPVSEAQPEDTVISETNTTTDIVEGKLYITPATLTIKTNSKQSKMYGCAYNLSTISADDVLKSYKYDEGYVLCNEGVGDYYDLGYGYTVIGDKDYQMAKATDFNSVSYTKEESAQYQVLGIAGNKFRPNDKNNETVLENRTNGLNNGTLYRIPISKYEKEPNGIKNSDYLQAAINAISETSKVYQGQAKGQYLIILGSLDASTNGRTEQCDGANNPVEGGKHECKNYIIDYYGTRVLQGDENVEQKYSDTSDMKFEIVQRKLYVYTEYNQKIYGDEDPNIEHICNEDDVKNRFCNEIGKKYEYGVSRYYTKSNSLAKAPWTERGIDDYQTDVIKGKLSRKGMGNSNPATNDIVGYYEYRYADADFGGTVEVIDNNYNPVYYNNDGLAVQEDGTTTMKVKLDGNEIEETKDVKFEIVLRKIKIAFISFDKVYGEEDYYKDYDILVCAPTDTFQFDTRSCEKTSEYDPHGLSKTHKEMYFEEIISGESVTGYRFTNQTKETFKEDFFVRYLRAYGENVTCTVSNDIIASATISGNFYNNGNEDHEYSASLNCKTIGELDYKTSKASVGKTVYETLAYIDQSANYPGYNYEVSYTIGYVNIVKRNITITPDENQGFQYGDYYNTLIPAITFTDSLNATSLNATGLTKKYGLVNGGADGTGICLHNIDGYHNGANPDENVGTCYNINDRKDEYDSMTSMTQGTSANINAKTGLGDTTSANKTYVFGDNYINETSDENRHALNRKYDNRNENERYNRNVGVYEITQGSIQNEIGNYIISFETGITYTITPAEITITPINEQYKIYGEYDEEIKFNVSTKYEVRHTHTDKDGNIVNEGTEITINGFAYEENTETYGYNYGRNKNKRKVGYAEINQLNVNGAFYFDIACRGAVEKGATSCDEQNRTLTYETTEKILLGYLHINWNQAAGVYDIQDGFVVALNGLGENKNYNKTFVQNVKFTIIPRPVGVKIADVTKTYGTSTDADGCDANVRNCSANGLLEDELYLKFNFSVSELQESLVSSIFGDELTKYKDNSSLYIISGLASRASYTQNGTADNKNNSSLGVYVSRDELNKNANACLYNGDKYGFCEDVGTYSLRLYGYANTIDNIDKDEYQSYRPTYPFSANADVISYYYGSYFGYNPNYFVLLVDNNGNVKERELENVEVLSTSRNHEQLLKSTATLTIVKKDISIYVNTRFNGEKPNMFTIQQNTKAPTLPTVNNEIELKYDLFGSNRETAVGGSESYGFVIWGLHNNQVRTGDKLIGELAYCNRIINEEAYKELTDNGMTAGYCSSELIYLNNRDRVNTNLEGYVPIVRDISMLSISNADGTTEGENKTGNATYENNNYTTIFYPGALTITKDETKPVVEVNHKDVYIEANAIGEYLFECVGKTGTTTYTNCNNQEGLSIVGKNELNTGDPILKWLNNSSNNEQVVIKISDFPSINNCGAGNYDCSLSAFYQYTYGKGSSSFNGINPAEDSTSFGPFRMWDEKYVKNKGPENLQEFIITLISWFGVTSYDEGEVKNGEYLDKRFDKYYYLIIEKDGTNGEFDISRVGNYKVHFYVMDNAGNVSEGNYYEKDADDNYVLTGDYSNIGTLHIIDTTAPIVGTLNLYNGKVICRSDCTKEENWIVADDTYISINTLYKYNSSGEPWSEGDVYFDLGETYESGETNFVKFNDIKEKKLLYVKNADGSYTKNNLLGTYVLIRANKKASALKHYSWSNSPNGIYLTITGGSDNSYTDNTSSTNSQWNHYFSRDGGVTWFLYDRSNNEGYLALAAEGIREIIIKAADKGVKINTATESSSTYVDKSYDNGSQITKTMTTYLFTDSSSADNELKAWEETYTSSILNEMGEEERKQKEQERQSIIRKVGWNQSEEAENNEDIADKISMLIYGTVKDTDKYTYYRDKQKAYLDWTLPIIEFISDTQSENYNGEKIYVYEFGCKELCTQGYVERYATGHDSITGTTRREEPNQGFNRNYSIFMGNGGDYSNISSESLLTSNVHSGLGNGLYSMLGDYESKSITSINPIERKYIMYVSIDLSDKGCTYNSSTGYSTCNLSNDITTDNIYTYIQNTIATGYNGDNGKDVTYQIHYSVIDKAGNESAYVSRGIIFANLVPTISAETQNSVLEQIATNTYSLRVAQGDKVEEIVKDLLVTANKEAGYITQTIYYNGKLVMENKRYNRNIYDEFTTSVPGVYEITYNLNYRYYGNNGKSELITADPLKLIIEVESTPPLVVSKSRTSNYTNIVLIISLLASTLFILVLSKKSRKKF